MFFHSSWLCHRNQTLDAMGMGTCYFAMSNSFLCHSMLHGISFYQATSSMPDNEARTMSKFFNSLCSRIFMWELLTMSKNECHGCMPLDLKKTNTIFDSWFPKNYELNCTLHIWKPLEQDMSTGRHWSFTMSQSKKNFTCRKCCFNLPSPESPPHVAFQVCSCKRKGFPKTSCLTN